VLVPRSGADQKDPLFQGTGSTPADSRPQGDSLPEKKDDLLARAPSVSGRAFAVLRNMATTAGAKGHRKPILRINLVRGYATVTSGAGTALTTVTTLHPQDCAEWSSFSGIFEEARCTGVSIWTTFVGASSSTALDSGAVAFDPANATAYSRLDEVMIAENALGPVITGISSSSTGESQGAIQPMSRTGYLKWGAKVCSGPTLAPGVSSTVVGGAWFDSSDSSEVVGYLKPYLENSSVGGSCSIRNFVVFHMEFRSRA